MGGGKGLLQLELEKLGDTTSGPLLGAVALTAVAAGMGSGLCVGTQGLLFLGVCWWSQPLSGLSCAGSIASDKLCLCSLQWERGSHGAGGDCKMVFMEKRSSGVCLIKQLQLHKGSRISRLLVVKRMKLKNKKSLCVWYENYRN